MPDTFDVQNTNMNDVDTVFTFFEHSIRYQEKHGYPVWKNYDRNAVIEDIRTGNHYKVVRDSEIAIVFSVCYTDKIIWQELEKGDALYLHRIVVNPDFKGQKLFGNILNWAIDECKRRNLKYVRMDT